MTLSELIEHVGNENVEFQMLDRNTKNIKAAQKGKDAEITFVTSDEKALDTMTGRNRFCGMILWLPRERMPKPATETEGS